MAAMGRMNAATMTMRAVFSVIAGPPWTPWKTAIPAPMDLGGETNRWRFVTTGHPFGARLGTSRYWVATPIECYANHSGEVDLLCSEQHGGGDGAKTSQPLPRGLGG